ncbi:putative SWI/SNF-related matrix-associated actin-dependent regulator of chromatin subfamily A member 3-like 2 [Grifola frondosa]|uniref:Putative SWI/SNF-related matrix-associated actin-dependent regulator of chromatin subfamily A member 3-like 2 n=1 Tax=Grifola frondosa TaxID=5627 RepID=A0A1C7MWB6_GRIFR|nr:putative SWI/SNF-related matrix-associated actin-dependent regulator of chromatin subfamily A member 3-like 2 [Grifola frondosa]
MSTQFSTSTAATLPAPSKSKRTCTLGRTFNASSNGAFANESSRFQSYQPSGLSPAMALSSLHPDNASHLSMAYPSHSQGYHSPIPNLIRPPPFTGPSNSAAFFQSHSQTPSAPNPLESSSQRPSQVASSSKADPRQVIDLTRSPSPQPDPHPSPLPPAPQPQSTDVNLPMDLPPKTPVCIGQLTVTALVLYPVPYLMPQEQNVMDSDWAPVRLNFEHIANKPGGHGETIHIKTPSEKSPSGEVIPGENFAVVEQKVATILGPMLGKGLIRLDAKVRRGLPNLPILPLQMLVYTPKGNIPVVSEYLHQSERPNGLHRPWRQWRRTVVHAHSIGKSVEVQRSQVDEVFKSLRGGDELEETEPPPEVATKLYPHQKKALTFLLEREQENVTSGKHNSLWQERENTLTHTRSWYHIVTQREVFERPHEAKGAILADDMGLGKTITCVALMAATLESAREFAESPLTYPPKPPDLRSSEPPLSAAHFAGSVWGLPQIMLESAPSKGKAKAMREHDRQGAEYARACRIKMKSRATLIICPLSTVVNWEDQFREHWRGEVTVYGGGAGGAPLQTQCSSSQPPSQDEEKPDIKKEISRVREGTPLHVYVYHGNARRPDPAFLANFDAVITTYATLASEFSKQTKSLEVPDDDDDDEDMSEGFLEVDESGNPVRLPKPKKVGAKKRKKTITAIGGGGAEVTSPLQSVHWFRVVLDEAHSIKETSTVGCRACCDLIADRRLCLTGTPVQNKLDDVYALIKFLKLAPFDDKNQWNEFIGTPVKYGQPLGVARLQTIMKCITLRRTKESKAEDGRRILALPPRRDELRYLKFDEQEQSIYDRFFTESKAEFNELSHKNEVMKNYVGILQKILRLRQICDHFELVQNKGLGLAGDNQSQEDVVAAIAKEGINLQRAAAIFMLLKESGTTQCVECGGELSSRWMPHRATAALLKLMPLRRRRSAEGSRSSQLHHLFCLECYRNCVYPGWPNVPPDLRRCCTACQTALAPLDAVEINPDCNLLDVVAKKKASAKKEKRQKGIALENFHPSTKVKALLGDLIQFSRANPYSTNYDPASIEVQMVDGDGNCLDDGVVKTVVFSQWTTMLDKIEDALEIAGIRYDRLDGTMKRDERTRAMDALKYDPGCEVLLVSLKAGGVGLNLTAAQRVYLMDPYWNPAVENQAVDRIHRLGQTRPVTTVKLIIENSIEARLLEVQKKKTELANMTLGQTLSKSELLQRRMEELNQLFRT